MIICYVLVVLFNLLLVHAPSKAIVTDPMNVEQQFISEIPVHTNTILPTQPPLSSLLHNKERIGASFIGGNVILLAVALITDFWATNPQTREKVVPLYISAVGVIVISFLGRFCKLFPNTNNEIAAFVTGAIGGLGAYQYFRSFYTT